MARNRCAGKHLKWDEAVIPSVATSVANKQLPKYSAFQIFQWMAGLGSLTNLEIGNNVSLEISKACFDFSQTYFLANSVYPKKCLIFNNSKFATEQRKWQIQKKTRPMWLVPISWIFILTWIFEHFYILWHFSFGSNLVLVTFQYWWHFSFGDIAVWVIFQFWWNFGLMTFQFW